MARTKPRAWCGIDGEGVGRNPHKYVFMAYADTLGIRDSIEDKRGLKTVDCLEFLLSIPTDRRVAGYYLGYDWTMILKDLGNKSIYRLLRPEMRTLPRDEGGGFSFVHWKGYRLHFLSGMMRIRSKKRSVTVWDVGKFFQAPFVDSLKNWDIKAGIAQIEAMKAKRSGFTELTDQIRDYCEEECESLAELCTALEKAHLDIGLKPKAWHGPGSTAGVALGSMGIKEKRGKAPPEVEQAASRAFFGGRFEHSTIGRYEHVRAYDIVSAYPYQAYNLPCLEHGVWEHTQKEKDLDQCRTACVRYHVLDVGNVAWAPLPCRTPQGSIVFARGGFSGWSWLPEWLVSKRWPGIEFQEAWTLHSDCDCRPFSKVLPWFRERVAMGKSTRGRVLKLALNSIYGKLAQSVGVPQYGSRIWSGLITSGTRAQLLEFALGHSSLENVYALATDGLFGSEWFDLPAEPLAPDLLGSWEFDGKDKDGDTMVFVRPGIYWSETSEKLRARGVGRKNLSGQRDVVLRAIEEKAERAVIGTSTVFGGARACIYNPNEIRRSRYYGEWHEIPARINLTPLPKRNPDWSLRMLDNVESAPYSKDTQSDDSRLLRFMADLFWGSK